MKYPHLLLIILSTLLVACSPHPGTGVWQAKSHNALGIDKLIVSFNGRAEFTSSGTQGANWHCFWAGIDKQQIELDCTPSTNPDQNQIFVLSANADATATMMQQEKTLATFTLLNENPVLEDKK